MQAVLCLVLMMSSLIDAVQVLCSHVNPLCIPSNMPIEYGYDDSPSSVNEILSETVLNKGCLVKWSLEPNSPVSRLTGFYLNVDFNPSNPFEIYFHVTNSTLNMQFEYLINGNDTYETYTATIMPYPTNKDYSNARSAQIECNSGQALKDFLAGAIVDVKVVNQELSRVTDECLEDLPQLEPYHLTLYFQPVPEIYQDIIVGYSLDLTCTRPNRLIVYGSKVNASTNLAASYSTLYPGMYYVGFEAYASNTTDPTDCYSGRKCHTAIYNLYVGDFLCIRAERALSCHMLVGAMLEHSFVGVFLVPDEKFQHTLSLNFSFSQQQQQPSGSVLMCNVVGTQLTHCEDITKNWNDSCPDFKFIPAPPTTTPIQTNPTPINAWIIVGVVAFVASTIFVLMLIRIKRRKNVTERLAIADFREHVRATPTPSTVEVVGHICRSYFKLEQLQGDGGTNRWRKFDKVLCLFSRPAQLRDFIEGRAEGPEAELFCSIRSQAADGLLLVTYGQLKDSSLENSTASLQVFCLPKDSRRLLQSLKVHDVDLGFLDMLIPHSECIVDPQLNVALDPDLYESMVDGDSPSW